MAPIWQSRLLELGEAYPAKPVIETQMKLHTAAVAGLNGCCSSGYRRMQAFPSHFRVRA